MTFEHGEEEHVMSQDFGFCGIISDETSLYFASLDLQIFKTGMVVQEKNVKKYYK